jgi:glycosyl-4,4'-diaponeurosporenoate acyltransferase
MRRPWWTGQVPSVRTPLGRLPWWSVVAANAVFWPSWTAACGYALHRLPRSVLADDTVVTRARSFEDHGHFYDRTLHIQRWKDRLPEAGAAFEGGFAKREVGGTDPATLGRFVAETRRAELTHWAVASGVVVPMLWNPWWALPAHLAVAAGSNLPCIAIQRYNRARLQRVLDRLSHRER